MSSGFVSGGTTDKPIERDDEWLKAQQEIESNRRREEETSRQQSGKTLYEVLQGNQAARQEAFEESIKLKNQFRNLDEDEIEFLDSVLESTRKKEEDVKRETTEQLDLFRRQQEQADRELLEDGGGAEAVKPETKAGSPQAAESQWAVNARKRKRAKEKESLRGVKLRKSSSTKEEPINLPGEKNEAERPSATASSTTIAHEQIHSKASSEDQSLVDLKHKASRVSETADSPKQASTAVLGLAGYSSDEY